MDRSGRNGNDAKGAAEGGADELRVPLERSPDGRIVIRSSSHPPGSEGQPASDASALAPPPPIGELPLPVSQESASHEPSTPPLPARGSDSSGVHDRPTGPRERGRPGRSTPAERPRKRKALQQSAPYAAELRARCDTPRLLPGGRNRDAHRVAPRAVANEPVPAPEVASAPPERSSVAQTASGTRSDLTPQEVTRRVRRLDLEAGDRDAGRRLLPWRGLLVAALLVASALLAAWLAG